MKQNPTRFFYYAPGGGLGHLTRSIALARQLAKICGGEHLVLTNSPFAENLSRQITDTVAGLRLEILPARIKPRDAGRAFAATSGQFHPDVLIVDTFPRGPGGELAAILSNGSSDNRATTNHDPATGKRTTLEQCRLRVLIGRSLPDDYVSEFEIRKFAAANFDLIIEPDESSTYEELPNSIATDRFLIRSVDELPSRELAAEILNADPGRAVLLVTASGNQGEVDDAIYLSRQLAADSRMKNVQIRTAVPRQAISADKSLISHWPMFECLPATDLIVSSAGYNVVAETDALRVPRILLPQQRKYDNQFRRAGQSGATIQPTLGELVKRIVQRWLSLESQPENRQSFEFSNGATSAAAKIVTAWRTANDVRIEQAKNGTGFRV